MVNRALSVLLWSLLALPAFGQESEDSSVSMQLNPREMTFHILNRLAFGPRPGQVDEVIKIGVMNWVLQQLDPAQIDDSACDKLIREHCPSMHMSMSKILETYRPPFENQPPTQAEQRRNNQLRARVQQELTASVLLRAVYSQRQLQEVLVEFWRNHFNIDQSKDQCQYITNHFEANAIRPHVFGKFSEMLMATAKHPAMLVYLDNARSQRPLSDDEKEKLEKYQDKLQRKRDKSFIEGQIAKLSRQRGLNENYARELFELHTLGVDNYYTQTDVIECARALTGWSVTFGQNEDFGFLFRDNVHDDQPKRVLGWSFTGKEGIQAGETIIERLAVHKGTAQFICMKLCRYLVNDRPPKELVDRVAKVFLDTQGDLKQVYMAIIFSNEFRSRFNYRCKFKTPFEFTVSALRATGAELRSPGGTLDNLAEMGQPIFRMDDPTGYYDVAEAWLDPGVLVFRWNFALQLAANRQPGARMPNDVYTPLLRLDGQELKQALIKQVLPAGVDAKFNQIMDRAIDQTPNKLQLATKLLGMLLGSPTFQQQ